MSYSIIDITELVRHHLVLATDDNEVAGANLAQLISNIEQMATQPPHPSTNG